MEQYPIPPERAKLVDEISIHHDMARVIEVADIAWELTMGSLKGYSPRELGEIGLWHAGNVRELFQILGDLPNVGETEETRQKQRDASIDAHVSTFQLPAASSPPEEHYYHVVHYPDIMSSPDCMEYELYSSANPFFVPQPTFYPSSKDPNTNRTGKLVGLPYVGKEMPNATKEVVAELARAQDRLVVFCDLGGVPVDDKYRAKKL